VFVQPDESGNMNESSPLKFLSISRAHKEVMSSQNIVSLIGLFCKRDLCSHPIMSHTLIGIGEAMAYAMYAAGAHVILSSRRTEELLRVRDQCLQNGISETCVAVCCSVLQCVAVCCSVLQCVAVCCSLNYM